MEDAALAARRFGSGPPLLLVHGYPTHGAAVARLLALAAPRRVAKLALIDTEIPRHRPPWIGLLQHVFRLPGAAGTCRMLLRSRTVQRSPMGFREFYSDTRLLDEPARPAPYAAPIVASARRADGMLRYLRGIDGRRSMDCGRDMPRSRRRCC